MAAASHLPQPKSPPPPLVKPHQLDNDNGLNHMISLYYCYPPTNIPPDQLNHHANFHRETCATLNLGGRIRVSEEGINGVLSGTEKALRDYETRLRKELMSIVSRDESFFVLNDNEDPTAEWLDMKYCHLRKDVPVEKQIFDTLSVKITREVVSLIEPVAEHKPKGRARCRQRRKQKRKEKQRLEKLLQNNTGEIDKKGPEELNSDTCEVEKSPASLTQQMESTNINGQGQQGSVAENVDTNQEGTALTIKDWEKHTPAVHLSPHEWNEKLLQLSREKHHEENNIAKSDIDTEEGAILLDTR